MSLKDTLLLEHRMQTDMDKKGSPNKHTLTGPGPLPFDVKSGSHSRLRPPVDVMVKENNERKRGITVQYQRGTS